jgi:hypothetical protein
VPVSVVDGRLSQVKIASRSKGATHLPCRHEEVTYVISRLHAGGAHLRYEGPSEIMSDHRSRGKTPARRLVHFDAFSDFGDFGDGCT